jgi:uncharacterized membrane protein YhaH (DUF805 family)
MGTGMAMMASMAGADKDDYGDGSIFLLAIPIVTGMVKEDLTWKFQYMQFQFDMDFSSLLLTLILLMIWLLVSLVSLTVMTVKRLRKLNK